MKVNLTVGLKDLAGKEIVDNNGTAIMLNKFVANQIVSEEAKENVLQRFELAMKLNVAEGEVEITESEKEIIKKVCEAGRMTILIAAQILSIINNAK
jgi:hypothetical protein